MKIPKISIKLALEFLIRRRWLLLILVVLVIGGAYLQRGGAEEEGVDMLYSVMRGPLSIKVLEGGSLEAMQSHEVRCEVRGRTKIISIIEEGYQITEEDVRNGKVLIELDSSELVDKLTAQKITFQSTEASLIEAKQSKEIQESENASNITSAEQDMQFARMDLEKYLGKLLAVEILELFKLEKEHPSKSGKGLSIPTFDFASLIEQDRLGDGEAKQRLRQLEDELLVAQTELGLSKEQLAGTRRLFENDYVTKTNLENEEIEVKKSELKLQKAKTELDLFVKYEFSKSAQQYLSKYNESVQQLVRARKEAVAKLAKAEAKFRSAESRFNLEKAEMKQLEDQFEKCTIRATHTGLVVYGGKSESYYRENEQIGEGTELRERQTIITIPNMAQMSMKVKIHESYIKKIKEGLEATITIDANPNRLLCGKVTKVAVLPDSQDRWRNPDNKVYNTTITILGEHKWLKPGMSAQTEILITKLENVAYVPLQAVHSYGSEKVCYVLESGNTVRRKIISGHFNDSFVEIKDGLNVGDNVFLQPPEWILAEDSKVKGNRVFVSPEEGVAKHRKVDKKTKGSSKKLGDGRKRSSQDT